MFERPKVFAGICTAAVACGIAAAPAQADDAAPNHILSAQNLCDLVWPTSQVMPDPARFGAVCVRHDGLLFRMSRALPNFFTSMFRLEPGSALELPVGSTRTNPNDPLSDWIIPDCSVPNRTDCSPT